MNVQTTGPAGRTLYMLDDNADFCATAKWWLAGAGYEVIDFQDAHLAIEAPGEETGNNWLEPVSDADYGKLK